MWFVFHRYAGYGVLHSFPTRRSSDLEPVAARTSKLGWVRTGSGPACAGWLMPATAPYGRVRTVPAQLPRVLPGRDGTGDRMRSEEHTSELQSHVKIVCRLLLEKKKYA